MKENLRERKVDLEVFNEFVVLALPSIRWFVREKGEDGGNYGGVYIGVEV